MKHKFVNTEKERKVCLHGEATDLWIYRMNLRNNLEKVPMAFSEYQPPCLRTYLIGRLLGD